MPFPEPLVFSLLGLAVWVLALALGQVIGWLSDRLGEFLLWLQMDLLKHEVRKREAAP